MKQELPIAIALLATGFMLWVTKSASTSDAIGAGDRATRQAATTPANNKTPAANKTIAGNKAIAGNEAIAGNKAIAGNSVPDIGDPRAKEILLQLASHLRNGPPRQGTLSIQSHLFGKSMTINGRFWQLGQSSLKSRIELIPDSRAPTKTTHLCDGRFCYRLTETGQQQKLSFYDLTSLEGSLPTINSHWIPTASIDRLFSFLASSFKFRLSTANDDPSVVELVGTWIPEDLAKLMINHVHHGLIVPKIQYEKLPTQFPHAVRVRLKRDMLYPDQWAPVSVEFMQVKKDTPSQLTTAMSILFQSIQPGANDASLFQMETVTGRSTDVSPRYSRRLEVMFGKGRVADSAHGTNSAAPGAR